jgi:hypothetical protein
VQERFTWSAVARATVAEYERAIAAQRRPGDQAGPGEQARGADQDRTAQDARTSERDLSPPEPKGAGQC